MKVGILPGDLTLSVSESGETNANAILSTAYNVLPLWLRIARDALLQAKTASDAISTNWGVSDGQNHKLLAAELTPSLQVFVASGIALDALYDQFRPYAKLEPTLVQKWRSNKTSRATQIAEVLRRVFKYKKDLHAQIKKNIAAIIQARDQAVHPSLELKNTCNRPDIPVGVDWKFAMYRYPNSEKCFKSMIELLSFLHGKGSANPEVKIQLDNVFEALQELGVVSIAPIEKSETQFA